MPLRDFYTAARATTNSPPTPEEAIERRGRNLDRVKTVYRTLVRWFDAVDGYILIKIIEVLERATRR